MENVNEEVEINELYENMKLVLVKTAEEVVPKKTKSNQSWMTDEILELMDVRRKVKNNEEQYQQLNIAIRKKM